MRKSVPISKRSFTNQGGFVEYSHGKASPPVKPATAEAAKTTLVVLMNDDAVIKQSISTEDLASFVKAVEKTIVDYFSAKKNRTSSYDMIIQAQLKPRGQTTYKIFHKPAGIPDQVINELYSALGKIPTQDPANEVDAELVMKVSL
jgi:hypothetical protein